MQKRQAAITKAGQDIGPIPKIVNPGRRRRGINSFGYFCRTYFPEAFTLAWSDYHKSAAAKIERAVKSGGLYAFAMPRGSGKTTICEWAVLWSALTGYSNYTVLVGASERSAEQRLANLKTSLLINDLLLDDFPEVCYPIRCLGRSARRAEGQKQEGQSTAIEWKAKRIVLPTVRRQGKQTKSSGTVIEVFGITGELRGLNHQLQTGEIVRPQLAICDDPQTRESAKSVSQSAERERILAGDIAYLAGPGKGIAVVMPCTVIYEDDMADNILNREKHPEWQGERTSMVDTFPDDVDKWDKYADILRSSLQNDGDGSAATEYYIENREAMDAGASVTWPDRYRDDEVSGVQHAMNLRIRDEHSFWSECQNKPIRSASDLELLTSDEISKKINGYNRGEIPAKTTAITAMIDVQGTLLYYVVTAWLDDYTGYIIDYGSYPDQGSREYYTLSDARRTLRRAHKGDDEAAIFAGVTTLVDLLCGNEWTRDDGASMRVTKCLVDCNWGGTSALVNSALRQSPHAAVLVPSYGRGITVRAAPISSWRQVQGTKDGPEWARTQAKGRQLVGVIYDVNYWKKRYHDSLALELGTRGSISLYKSRPASHKMFADHSAAELPKKMTAGKRTVYEWNLRDESRDNHLFDCAVGTLVGASLSGIRQAGVGIAKKKKRMVSYAN